MTTGHDDEDLLEAEVIAEDRRARRRPLRLVVGVFVIAVVLALGRWQRERIGRWFTDRLTGDHGRPLPQEPVIAGSDRPAPAPTGVHPAAGPGLADDSATMAAWARRLARLEDDQAALARQVRDLARDLAELARRRSEAEPAPRPEWPLAVTLARIALKLESGGDLLAERLALQALLPTLPAAARDDAAALLDASAALATDLAGRARLLALFDRAIRASRKTSAATADGSWWRRWLAALRHLVQIRRRDRPQERMDEGESLATHALELARARFLAGDLDQAVDALVSLGSDVDPVTAELRARLVRRRALLRALEALLRSLARAAATTPVPGEGPGGTDASPADTTDGREGT